MPKDLKIGPLKLSSEVIIMIVVMLLSTFWNLVYAVGIGLVISSLIFMKKMGDLTADKSRVNSLLKEDAWQDEANFPKNLKEEVFIKHINGPLFFGSTNEFQALIKQIPTTASTVIIRMDKMDYLDQSGLYAIEDVLIDLKKQKITILFVGLLEQPQLLMKTIDIIPNLVSNEFIFNDFSSCLKWINSSIKDTI